MEPCSVVISPHSVLEIIFAESRFEDRWDLSVNCKYRQKPGRLDQLPLICYRLIGSDGMTGNSGSNSGTQMLLCQSISPRPVPVYTRGLFATIVYVTAKSRVLSFPPPQICKG